MHCERRTTCVRSPPCFLHGPNTRQVRSSARNPRPAPPRDATPHHTTPHTHILSVNEDNEALTWHSHSCLCCEMRAACPAGCPPLPQRRRQLLLKKGRTPSQKAHPKLNTTIGPRSFQSWLKITVDAPKKIQEIPSCARASFPVGWACLLKREEEQKHTPKKTHTSTNNKKQPNKNRRGGRTSQLFVRWPASAPP